MILRKLVTNDWIHVSHGLDSRDVERVGVSWHCKSLFWGVSVGMLNTKKTGDHWNKKLFIKKSLKALIKLTRPSGSIETACSFERVFHYQWENGAPKRKFCLKLKNNMWGGLSRPIEIFVSFGGSLKFLMNKWGGNKRKRFYSEMWIRPISGERRGEVVKIPWNSPCVADL